MNEWMNEWMHEWNKQTTIYLKYIYFVLSIVQIILRNYVLNKKNKKPCNCTFGIINWYTKIVLNWNNYFVLNAL